jgi:hypothetical protein
LDVGPPQAPKNKPVLSLFLCDCLSLFRYFECGVYNGITESCVVPEVAKSLSIDPSSIILWPVFSPVDIGLMKEYKEKGKT